MASDYLSKIWVMGWFVLAGPERFQVVLERSVLLAVPRLPPHRAGVIINEEIYYSAVISGSLRGRVAAPSAAALPSCFPTGCP